MKRLQAYKFQLMPNGEQTRLMRKFCGSCRFVYNYALQIQKENHEAGKPFISYVWTVSRNMRYSCAAANGPKNKI